VGTEHVEATSLWYVIDPHIVLASRGWSCPDFVEDRRLRDTGVAVHLFSFTMGEMDGRGVPPMGIGEALDSVTDGEPCRTVTLEPRAA